MEETVQHVEEMLDASPVVDVHDTFAQFQQLLADLKAKIDARFATTRDPSTESLEQYGTYPEGPGGRVAAYSGPEVDWMVHSWLGDPSRSFVNLHLTCWLGPQVKVPHLGIAPAVLAGRLVLHRLHPAGRHHRRRRLLRPLLRADQRGVAGAAKADPEFAWFTSRAAFIRASLSPNAYCTRSSARHGISRSSATGCTPRSTSGSPGSTRPPPVPSDERDALRAPGPRDPAQHRRPRPGQRDGRAVLRRGDHPAPRARPLGRRPRTA